MPQWIYGMSTTAWDGNAVLAAVCEQGRWHLDRLGTDGTVTMVEQPFDDLAGLRARDGRAVAIASHGGAGMGLLELDLASGEWSHTQASPAVFPAAQISHAEALWFEGAGGQRTHAWYYPPMTGQTSPAPLLVKGHSGPTAMARTGLNLGIQFWTSRGWGVVDVNYGGSTGFGRAYRDRLQGGWGAVDVEDCAAAAKALIARGKANPDQIAMEGGSAGGFTTLACLCFTDIFRAGACRYAVSDLKTMASDTHRFEARYLDGLVGPWPQAQQRYERRSPCSMPNGSAVRSSFSKASKIRWCCQSRPNGWPQLCAAMGCPWRCAPSRTKAMASATARFRWPYWRPPKPFSAITWGSDQAGRNAVHGTGHARRASAQG